MDIIGGAILTAAALNLFAGVFILFYGKKTAANISFVIVVVSVFVWAISIFFFREAQQGAEFWVRTLHVAAIVMVAAFFTFSIVFGHVARRYHRAIRWVCYLLGGGIIAGLILSDVLIAGYSISISGKNFAEYGPLFTVYRLYIIGFFLWSFAELFQKFFRAEGTSRKQLAWIIGGTLLPVIVGITTNLILPIFGIVELNWFGQVFSITMVVVIAYTIAKFNFLNTSLFSSQMFVAALLIITFLQIFSSRSSEELYLRILFFLFVVLFSHRLVKSIAREIKKERQLEKLTEELEKANRELQKLDDAKSEFISIASHQLRTPLTAIKGYLSLVREGLYGPIHKPIEGVFTKVYASNERLINLVEDLLSISRIESGRMEYNFTKVDMGTIVRSLHDTFVLRARKKRLDFVIDADPEQRFFVNADPEMIREVISNFIDNAIKYTEEGFVHVSVKMANNHVTVAVVDSGIGIPKAVIPTLFTKFSRGKDPARLHVEGTGLGLYVGKSIVEEHGGEIIVESEGRDMGSTFSLVLPSQEKYKHAVKK